jgi:hypothetical protein
MWGQIPGSCKSFGEAASWTGTIKTTVASKKAGGGLPPPPLIGGLGMDNPNIFLKPENEVEAKPCLEETNRANGASLKPPHGTTNALSNYIPGSFHMVDYAIEHYGAEVISVEDRPLKQLPFPGLTGASNTNE